MNEARDLGLARLEAERSRLQAQLAQVGDGRQGSLTATYRHWRRAYRACSEPSHPGHGPIHLLTKSVQGKTATRAVPQGPSLAKVQREADRYRRFKAVVEQIV